MNKFFDGNKKSNCGKVPMPDIGLAQTYIKVQPYIGLFPIDEGFSKGNMFPNLYQPYR